MSKIRWGAGGKNSGDRRQEKRGGMGEGSGLVSTAGDGIIVDVATLVRANPYLRKTGARREGPNSLGCLVQASPDSFGEEIGQGGIILRVPTRDRDEISFLPFPAPLDRKSTRLNSSHLVISYAV